MSEAWKVSETDSLPAVLSAIVGASSGSVKVVLRMIRAFAFIVWSNPAPDVGGIRASGRAASERAQ
jgi:hypothetical protein